MKKKDFISWNGIRFINKKQISIEDDILTAKLITVPAAPALYSNHNIEIYNESLRSADFSIIDSSFFAILCRTKFLKIYKYSGFRLMFDIINYLKNVNISIFLIDSSESSAFLNREFILKETKTSILNYNNYIAPIYNVKSDISDVNLLEKLESQKPRLIVIGIAGGKQEILGNYLKKKLSFQTTILCTGAALSFFTGEQASLNLFIDRFYLDWFFRILNNPKVFLPRYLHAFKFVFIFYKHSIEFN